MINCCWICWASVSDGLPYGVGVSQNGAGGTPSAMDGQAERRVTGSERVKRPTTIRLVLRSAVLGQACDRRLLSRRGLAGCV